MQKVLIRGGYLLDGDRPLETGDVLVTDGLIETVGGSIDALDAEVIEARGRIVMPGLVNAHTHSNQAIEKGLADKLPLDAWMVLASYGGAGVRLNPRDLYVSTMVGALEMLRTGTTAVLDCARSDVEWFGEGMDAVMGAYADAGMRAGVAAQFSDLDFFSSLPLALVTGDRQDLRHRVSIDEMVGHVKGFLSRWHDRNPRLQALVAPSSLPRCSTELFEASVELARSEGVRFQTHLLSAKSQVPIAEERYGMSTVEFLGELGCLEEWASFAHAIWLSPREVRLFAESSALAVHNPVSNLKLGAGLAPVPELQAHGARVALGADGASSNDSQNMFETVKYAALVHRVAPAAHRWPGAQDVLQMCWRGGAQALGRDIGRLRPGARGDIVVLDPESPFAESQSQIMQQLVYAESGRSVVTVLVDGRVVIDDGEVLTVDADSLREEARELVQRIWREMPDRLQRFEEIRPELESLESKVRDLPLGFSRCL